MVSSGSTQGERGRRRSLAWSLGAAVLGSLLLCLQVAPRSGDGPSITAGADAVVAGDAPVLTVGHAQPGDVDVLARRKLAVQLERELRGDRPKSSRVDILLVRPDVSATVWWRGRVQEIETTLPLGTYRWQRGSGRDPDDPPELTIGLR